jgi:hypothetical protein
MTHQHTTDIKSVLTLFSNLMSVCALFLTYSTNLTLRVIFIFNLYFHSFIHVVTYSVLIIVFDNIYRCRIVA